jgi:hypothetical protein
MLRPSQKWGGFFIEGNGGKMRMKGSQGEGEKGRRGEEEKG